MTIVQSISVHSPCVFCPGPFWYCSYMPIRLSLSTVFKYSNPEQSSTSLFYHLLRRCVNTGLKKPSLQRAQSKQLRFGWPCTGSVIHSSSFKVSVKNHSQLAGLYTLAPCLQHAGPSACIPHCGLWMCLFLFSVLSILILHIFEAV